jgi:hypothetical protein
MFYPGFRIRPFSHPGSGSEHFFHPGSRIPHEKWNASFLFFLLLKLSGAVLVSQKDPGSGKNSSRIRIPDPGGKKAPDPGSGSAKLVTGNEQIHRIQILIEIRVLIYL